MAKITELKGAQRTWWYLAARCLPHASR